MTLWIISTLLTSAATILITAPFISRIAALRSTQEPAATKNDQTKKTGSNQLKPSRSAVSVTSGLVVLICTALYMLSHNHGAPDEVSLPRLSALPLTSQLSSRDANQPPLQQNLGSADQAIEQLKRFVSGDTSIQSAPNSGSGLPPVDELIERLSARLQKNPNDISGWRTLGWSQFNLQHYSEAAADYAKAIQIFPNVADLYSLRGEALVQAANGAVTEESKQAFTEALKLDAKDTRARFFNGLAKAQAGDKASALDIWIDVANDAGTNDTILPTLKQHIASLAKELNVDVNKKLKRPLDLAAPPTEAAKSPDVAGTAKLLPVPSKDRDIFGSPSPQPAPAKDRDIAAIAPAPRNEPAPNASMAPGNSTDQTAMIRGMVDRLTNRLSQSPRDVDGWIMLMRSRLVLNEQPAAQEALSHALKVFEQQSPERDRLTAAAKEFGLKP
jgi:cytochrome c-type biogenesis protein CcmH